LAFPRPAAANVPALKDNDVGVRPTTMRERMEQHRKNPVCAACHNMLDPLGFALENFDAVGKWRTQEGVTAVNASGAFPTGAHEKFDNPSEFRDSLLQHREEFVQTMVVKLMTFAIGRGVEYYDMPTVRRIQADAKAADYRWSAIIAGVVQSPAFQMRRAEAGAPTIKAEKPSKAQREKAGQ